MSRDDGDVGGPISSVSLTELYGYGFGFSTSGNSIKLAWPSVDE
jgi:hypothetical protein